MKKKLAAIAMATAMAASLAACSSKPAETTAAAASASWVQAILLPQPLE